MKSILQCKGISKRIGHFYLQDINFQLEPGYILGVVGRSGAGKSTLVRILLGSYPLYRYPKDIGWTAKYCICDTSGGGVRTDSRLSSLDRRREAESIL